MSATHPPALSETMPPIGTTPARARVRAAVSGLLPRGALVLSVLTLAGYAMGLVRDRAFARAFGAGGDLDAYNAAFVLPELALDVLVAGGLVAPFIPIFTGLRGDRDRDAREFGRTILTYAVLVMAAAAALLFVLAPQTVALIAPGFQGAQRDLYVSLFRVMCVTPVIFAASIVLGEILVAERRLLAYGLAPLMYNGGIVLGVLLLADRYGIFGAAIGAVVGAFAHLGIRVVGIARTTFRPRPRLSLRTRGLGEFMRLMVPKMVSHPIEPLTFLFFTALASSLEPGSVSSVSFARNFASVPVSLFGAAFAIAAFPTLSAAFARGDRPAFVRTFGTNFAAITGLTVAAMVGLLVVGGLAIRVLLGGGAFDDEDIARTAGVLAVFAIAVPLESMTHLLSRGLYATHNTLLPSIASVAGFVVTVIVAEALAPSVGLAAIPVSFAAGMALKVALMALALAPRIVRIGRTSVPVADQPSRPLPRRLGRALAGWALVALAASTLYATSQAFSGVSLSVAPAVTPWARANAPSPSRPASSSVPGAISTASPGGPSASPDGPNASPTPKPGPFSMDLYEKGDYVGEFKDTWCLAAAVQISMNIMDAGADRTRSTQARIFALTRSLDPAPDGAAEPEAWAKGLTDLGYGSYEVSVQPSIKAAIHLAAKQIRLTNRPAGLLVWRGAHSWVMSGFAATADPAVTEKFTVTSVRIEDVWYPRFSTIWGYSRPPDAKVAVADLSDDFLPWHRPKGSYPDKNGKYVIVIPTE